MSGELCHMARAGKSFFFASLWLPRAVRADAALAYRFCRAVDDIADGSSDLPRARGVLQGLYTEVERGEPTSELAMAAQRLIEKYPEVHRPLLDLVQACFDDGPGVRIADCDDLVRYAQGVAGTVGLIMYPMLGGTDPQGRAHAVALGVAMQCTNICRDVFEDLQNGRVYLPRQWLGDITIERLLEGDTNTEQAVVAAVERVLSFARSQYEFAVEGLSYLNPSCRRAIEIAARVYAEIGAGVIQEGRLIRGRSVVSLLQKALIALKVYWGARRVGEPALIFSK